MFIYLYIKKHNITGLRYFGVTTRQDPYKYKGSGTYWKRHIKTHGNDVTTEWVKQFDSIQECNEYALQFSRDNNIVNSEEWANLVDEDGNLYKGIYGFNKHSDETKAKIGQASKGRKVSDETKQLLREAKLGKKYTEEHKRKMSIAHSGKKFTEDHKRKLSESRKGMRWYNNGIVNLKAYPDQVPESFNPGMLPHSLQRNVN